MGVPYRLVLPALQIKHWAMTVGVANYFHDFYGHDWLAIPEIETEIGWNEAEMEAWDFTPESLRQIVTHGVQGQYDAGLFPKGVTVDEVVAEVFDIPEEWTDYLNERYPWFGQPKYHKPGKTGKQKAA
jgi:hypothetical protein